MNGSESFLLVRAGRARTSDLALSVAVLCGCAHGMSLIVEESDSACVLVSALLARANGMGGSP